MVACQAASLLISICQPGAIVRSRPISRASDLVDRGTLAILRSSPSNITIDWVPRSRGRGRMTIRGHWRSLRVDGYALRDPVGLVSTSRSCIVSVIVPCPSPLTSQPLQVDEPARIVILQEKPHYPTRSSYTLHRTHEAVSSGFDLRGLDHRAESPSVQPGSSRTRSGLAHEGTFHDRDTEDGEPA